jgi:ribosomal protein S18 acetylase RimI-like enzyme
MEIKLNSKALQFRTRPDSIVSHQTQDRMSTICTRIATLADLDVIAPLFDAYRQFYAQAPDLALARDFICERLQNNESVVLLASNEAQTVVGFCQLYPTFCSVEAKPIYSLYDLFVSPEARRSGAGKVLLQAAEKFAAVSGRARMDLTTAKTNKPAQAAYESLGWVRDEVFYAYSKSVDV